MDNSRSSEPLVAALNSRVGIADTLATATPALLCSDEGVSERRLPRRAQYTWDFEATKRIQGNPPEEVDPPEPLADAVRWLEKHTLSVSAFNDPATIRRVLAALGLKQDGTKAAASTIARKRAVLHNFLEYTIELGHLDKNAMQEAKKRKRAPKTVETVDAEAPLYRYARTTSFRRRSRGSGAGSICASQRPRSRWRERQRNSQGKAPAHTSGGERLSSRALPSASRGADPRSHPALRHGARRASVSRRSRRPGSGQCDQRGVEGRTQGRSHQA